MVYKTEPKYLDNDDIHDIINDGVQTQHPLNFNAEAVATQIIKNMDEQENNQLDPWHDPQSKYYPNIKMKWLRFPEKIDFKAALLNLVSGPRGQGKSALLEVLSWLAIKHKGAKGIIDLFSARDSEGLGFIRNKILGDSVLLIHGNNTKVACEYDTVPVGKATLEQILQYKLVITVPKFYRNPSEEFESLGRLLRLFWDRDHWDEGDLRVLNFREGINIGSSRLSMGEKSGQSDAKAQFIYALNQFRHAGFMVNLDCLRLKSVDINVREISDFIWLKHQGIFGPTDDLRFLFKRYDLIRDFMRIPKWGFVIVSTKGGYGHGVFQRPYWHKETHENISKIVGITAVEYDDFEQVKLPKSSFTDFDHVALINKRFELSDKGKPKGVHIIAKEMNISTATPTLHFDYHNNDIQTKGECQRCKRAKCSLSKTIINKYVTLQRNKDCTLPSTPKVFAQKQAPPPRNALPPQSLPVPPQIQPTLHEPPVKPPQPEIKSKAKSDVEHEDESNLESSPYYGENNTGD